MKKMKKGFTIVELVIVIGVIGILSAILIPTFVNLTNNAKIAALKSDLDSSYRMYLADAADNVVDEGDAKGEKIEQYAQDKVVLTEETNASTISGYIYTVENGWSTDAADFVVGTTENTFKLVVDHKYGNYFVYYKVPAAA